MPEAPTERDWDLPSNIILTFSYQGALPLWAFEELLTAAIKDFGERKDRHEEFFSDFPWECWITDDDEDVSATGWLVIHADLPLLETERWIKALIDAHTTGRILMNIAEHIEEDRPKADGWLKSAIEAMDSPNGHLDALDIALRHFNPLSVLTGSIAEKIAYRRGLQPRCVAGEPGPRSARGPRHWPAVEIDRWHRPFEHDDLKATLALDG